MIKRLIFSLLACIISSTVNSYSQQFNQMPEMINRSLIKYIEVIEASQSEHIGEYRNLQETYLLIDNYPLGFDFSSEIKDKGFKYISFDYGFGKILKKPRIVIFFSGPALIDDKVIFTFSPRSVLQKGDKIIVSKSGSVTCTWSYSADEAGGCSIILLWTVFSRPMKYFFRFILYIAIFFAVFSVSCVTLLKFVPVTITPLKLIKLTENYKDHGLKVYSKWKPLKDISLELQKAVIATEDNNFFSHNGFDIDAIKKAIEYNKKKGDRIRGASTISQQTAKNVFCYTSRTWLRKAIESYYTVLIELIWSKRRIMEVYVNVIETHPNIYGAQATARYFYNKDASLLNNYEAAMIATVLPSPARMNIGKPSKYMVRRSAVVRELMLRIPPVDYNNSQKDK